MIKPKVCVAGYKGKTGSVVARALVQSDEFEYVGGIGSGDDLSRFLNQHSPNVLVDFTTASAAFQNGITAAQYGVAPVIGTTGLGVDQIDQIQNVCAENGVGGIVAANFALGAVLMMHIAGICARYMEAAEIIEAHHERKKDAPSGTAVATASIILANAKGIKRHTSSDIKVDNVFGGDIGGVGIHSLRIPGVMAEQVVKFGAPGETLEIVHRTVSRECYVPGVFVSIRAVLETKRFYRSLGEVLGLH